MPDFQNFKIVRDPKVITGTPKFNIYCDVVHSSTGEKLASINTNFPEIMESFTDTELEEVMHSVVNILLNKQIEKNTDNVGGRVQKFELLSKEVAAAIAIDNPPKDEDPIKEIDPVKGEPAVDVIINP